MAESKIQKYFANLWSKIQGNLITEMSGNFRGHSKYWGSEKTASGRNYDLEIQETPIRDMDGRSRELIELHQWCPEVTFAINALVQDCLSSADGDDQGIVINKEIREGEKINPVVYDIGMDAIDRLLHYGDLSVVIERMLCWGDAFLELGADLKSMQIVKTQVLPTFEMFRIEKEGQLSFEQRRSLAPNDAIIIPAAKLIHFRYRQKSLYGRGVFSASLEDWQRLREATEDLALASREIGLNPTWHKIPIDQSVAYREAYRENHQAQLEEGAIAHYYLMPGEEIGKVGSVNPDLKPLLESVLHWRSRIIMASGVPSYLFAGLPTTGAKDISGQPAMSYARRINAIRAQVTEGIKQLIDTQLYLSGVPKDQWKYTIGWPKISVSQFAETDHIDTEKKSLERLVREF